MKNFYAVLVLLCLMVYISAVFIAQGRLAYFFDPPSLVIILFPALFLLLTHFSAGEIVNSFKVPFREEKISREDLQLALLFSQSFQKYLITTGFIGFIFGFVMLLSNISDAKNFGIGLSCSLLSIVYATMIILMVIIPFQQSIKRKIAED